MSGTRTLIRQLITSWSPNPIPVLPLPPPKGFYLLRLEGVCDPEEIFFMLMQYSVFIEYTPDSRGWRDLGCEPAPKANREAAICFWFWPGEEASMAASLFSPVPQPRPVFVRCQKDEGFELNTQNLKDPGVNRSLRGAQDRGGRYGDLDDLGGLSDWLKAYGLWLKPFQPISNVPSVILGLCLVCRDLLK